MKITSLINYPLKLIGLKVARIRKLKFINNEDLLADAEFLSIYEKIKDNTLVPFERCYALYTSIKHIIKNNLQGDLVECGVWKGGSCMLMAYTLLQCGVSTKKIYLYDTFMGMPEPGIQDGDEGREEWEKGRGGAGHNKMCYSPLEEVRKNMQSTGYPAKNIIFVQGKVEQTIPEKAPQNIALLRLDTDWYSSTLHELKYMFPLLVENGILIIDDYGAWVGAKKAVDEYFETIPEAYLHRTDYAGRLVIKR